MAPGGDVRAGRAYVEIAARPQKLRQDLQRSMGDVRRWRSEASRVAASFSLGGLNLIRPILANAKAFAASAGQAERMRAQTGLSARAIAGLQLAGERAGISAEEMFSSLSALRGRTAKGATETANAFAQLGERIGAVQAKPLADVISIIADRLPGMATDADRVETLIGLFGESGARMLPVFERGSAGLSEMVREAERLGMVLQPGDEVVARDLKSDLEQLEKSFSKLEKTIARTLAGPLGKLVDKLTEIIEATDKWANANPELADALGKTALGVAAVTGATIVGRPVVQAGKSLVGGARTLFGGAATVAGAALRQLPAAAPAAAPIGEVLSQRVAAARATRGLAPLATQSSLLGAAGKAAGRWLPFIGAATLVPDAIDAFTPARFESDELTPAERERMIASARAEQSGLVDAPREIVEPLKTIAENTAPEVTQDEQQQPQQQREPTVAGVPSTNWRGITPRSLAEIIEQRTPLPLPPTSRTIGDEFTRQAPKAPILTETAIRDTKKQVSDLLQDGVLREIDGLTKSIQTQVRNGTEARGTFGSTAAELGGFGMTRENRSERLQEKMVDHLSDIADRLRATGVMQFQ